MIRAAGAREVHMRISSPPTIGPCHYGIDTPDRNKLIASSHTVEEVRRFVGADTLGYLSIEGLREAVSKVLTGQKHRGLCDGCFTNNYPIPLPAPVRARQLRLISL